MARTKKTDKAPENVENLLAALAFINYAQAATGDIAQTHCRLGFNAITAFDGIVAAGVVVDHELMACPQTGKLIAALKQCKADASVTLTGAGHVAVHSGKFKAVVPSVEPDALPWIDPEPCVAPFPRAVIDAMQVAGSVVTEGAQRVSCAAVMLKANTAVGTNAHVVIEAWHGADLPPMLVPKAFVATLGKIALEPTGFGFSERSLTVWFGETTWLRTQLYSETYPDTDALQNIDAVFEPIHANFNAAIEALAPFVDGANALYFRPDGVGTTCVAEDGATYAETGLAPIGITANAGYLAAVAPYAAKLAFVEKHPRNGGPTLLFTGARARGCVALIR